MASTLNFRSVNDFNVFVNTISGNFFPLDSEKTNLGFFRKTYMIFTWIVLGLYMLTTTLGVLFYVPAIVAIRDGGISAIVSFEVIILVPYFKFRSDRLRVIIDDINSILVDSNDLRRCIRDSVGRYKKIMKFFSMATMSSTASWVALPAFKLIGGEQNNFSYTDFVTPTYYPGAPFTINGFCWGIAFQMFGALYLIGKKNAIDVYISNLITLLVAEYRCLHGQITVALGQKKNSINEKLVINELKKCIRHHLIIMKIGQMVTELLSLNVGLTYLNCILRFCFTGFSVVSVPDDMLRLTYVLYMMGTLVQVYTLCLCAQELLDASTGVTDEAFHGDWYEREKTVKNIYLTMILGNKLECRLSAFRIVDLTVPTFRMIVNQAYSVCLLLLRVD